MIYQEKDFVAKIKPVSAPPSDCKITCEAPSNIALVKYWGKYEGQIPMNPSISFTLNRCKTITSIHFKNKENNTSHIAFQFYFEGKHKPEFEPKIRLFFKKIYPFVPYLKDFSLTINSKNTFPHSSGIASSASAFAALSKVIISLEKKLFPGTPDDLLQAKQSFLARLGSGSASRSTDHPVMIWGKHPQIAGTSDLYAVQPEFELHKTFAGFQDTIVLVEEGKKAVSSTAGHQLMAQHPYKNIRKQQGFDNTLKMYNILQNGDIESFINLVEQEALSLHALMMTSQPNFLLLQPETLYIIHSIREYRQQTGSKLCFTLDAGANVHVLYPKIERQKVMDFIKSITTKNVISDYI